MTGNPLFSCIWKFAWKTSQDFSKREEYNDKEVRNEVIQIDKKRIEGGHLNGIYEEMSTLLGIDVTLKIYEHFKGQQISFPVRLFSQEFVMSEIARSYDGTNINALATKFGYSERWIREVLKKQIDK